MKKLVSIIALAVAVSVSANAQSLLGNLIGTLTTTDNTSTVANLVSGLAGSVYSAPVSLNGTYAYNGVAVSATSSEGGVINNLAGTAVTAGIEAKADEYLAKVGIKPGAVTFTFNNEDRTFTMNVGSLALPGNFKVGEGEKTVTLTFGKSMQYLCMTGTLESSLTGAKMMFPANKAMDLFKKVAKNLGEKSDSVASIAKLADGYDNYKIGFKLAKSLSPSN